MPYSPRIVANGLLYKANSVGKKLTHMQLQKLVFFMHAWNLALHDQPLLTEEFEAWPYGPVASSLYHELKGYGSVPVTNYLSELDAATGIVQPLIPNTADTSFWSLLEQVWQNYAQFSATQLSNMTHTAGSPWHKAREQLKQQIPDEWIGSYFKELAARYGNPPTPAASAPATAY